MLVLERLNVVLKIAFQEKNIYKKADMAKFLGYTNSYFSEITNGKEHLSDSFLKEISEKLDVNQDWILTGDGNMFNTPDVLEEPIFREPTYYGGDEQEREPGNLIPFYDDVETIGGVNALGANMDGVSQPSEYIDTGDWFREATAAIRHYGDSMIEYPAGCILAIKEVYDRELIIPGRDYVIETSEYRITKKVQRGKNEEYLRAYSTNEETYSDGRLIHEPFDIPWRAVRRIFLVLGYVVKKTGGTMVFNNPRTK